MAHTFTNLLTHMIFSTKDRMPFIEPELKPRLCAYLGGIVKELKGKPYSIDGTNDHVHMLVSLPPTLAIADALRIIKTNSSGCVHGLEARYRKFGWQIGYGAFSVSKSNVGAVVRYIQAQEEHHKTVTFKDEFIVYLKKHGIAYDERYIWE